MNTTTTINSALSEYYDRVLLERAVEENLHDQWAQVRPMKARNGKVIKFRRYESLAPATTPLSEGVTPAGSDLTKTDITATLAQYGDFITVTDVLDYTNPDAILTEAAEIQGEQMGETRDIIIRDIINAGSNVILENGTQNAVNRAAVSAPIEDDTMTLAVETLRTGKAKTIKELLKASVGISTQSVAPSYMALTHNLNVKKVKALSGFTKVKDYSVTSDLMRNEFGATDDVRWAWGNNTKVWAGAGAAGKDVYSTLIFGKNAYGVVPFERGTAKNIIKPLGSGGTEDPLNQRATSGWKMMFTCVILNDDYMLRIESTLA